jgi:hypothetical protein
MKSDHKIVAQSFAKLANDYCNWCEGASLEENADVQAATWMCKLYAAALMLPPVDPENSDGPPDLPADKLNKAVSNLSCFNGDYYREYFDPDPMLTDESGIGDVGDDLLDIYKDVKSGLVLFERGQSLEALWQWSFLHHIHWGRHAVGALFALHNLSISKRDKY